MGGSPSKGTKPDMRLKRNNPNAGKLKAAKPAPLSRMSVKKAGK